jgi:hypothetical protein
MSNSIGDLKNSGLQGNNWPWQYRVLKGLDGIIDALTAGVCCPPQVRRPVVVYETLPGLVPDGTYGFSIANVGAAAGTVDGQSLPAGVTINFDPGVNNIIKGITYDATGTTFLITYIV